MRYGVIFLVLFLQTCCCMNSSNDHICRPSSCGNIGNISYPFRLKNDPKHCGDPDHELECENNVSTTLYLDSQKYLQVKAINYNNFTIRLVDVSMKLNDTCSFPIHSLTFDYQVFGYYSNFFRRRIAWPINYMRCPYALKDSSGFTEFPSHCAASTHTYIKVGHMTASDVRDNSSVDPIVFTSWKFNKDVSFSEIHDSLLYGFDLSWDRLWCMRCKGSEVTKCAYQYEDLTCTHVLGSKLLDALWDNIKYPNQNPVGSGPSVAAVLILLLILGVSIPAKIIIGFLCAWGFIKIELNNEYFNTSWHISRWRYIIGLFFSVRLIIVGPFMMWYFIYKFRTRHLSRYDVIEDFLQSDNHLMPIRYSYSDIKKMTRGFREKLGQGGYGTVYKGKLRSGYDVAVKLLGKPGGNGQDFMNEISTIGRIHHVNLVNLVGYCAERSKRALVFDFMPNGSLDKYIFGPERMNCLTWERKYEIAVGVARGIEYLHKGCNIQILHFDIKPHNILLDDNFTPKITDFGLAKFFSTDKKMVTLTAVRGTIGYVAPELLNRGFGGVSYKADVYSFGMLLMEMVGLNKDCNPNNQASSQYFPCWIYDCFEQGQDIEYEVIDENNDDTDRKIAKKMTIVALWCIQMSPIDRPSMNKVLKMLEAPVERLQVPNRTSQSAQVAANGDDLQSWTTYSTDSISLLGHDAAPSVEITVED